MSNNELNECLCKEKSNNNQKVTLHLHLALRGSQGIKKCICMPISVTKCIAMKLKMMA